MASGVRSEPFLRELRRRCDRDTDRPALVSAGLTGQRCYTWRQVDEISDAVAARLARHGLSEDRALTIVPGTDPAAAVLVALSAWKCGAAAILTDAVRPQTGDVGYVAWGGQSSPPVDGENCWTIADLVATPAAVPADWSPRLDSICRSGCMSSGTTGPRRIIVGRRGHRYHQAHPLFARLGAGRDRVQVVASPLDHLLGMQFALDGLLHFGTTVCLDYVTPQCVRRVVGSHEVDLLVTVPAMMARLASMDGAATWLPTIARLLHAGAPCPPPVKRQWLELIGPSNVFEMYSMTETLGTTFIDGDQWLAHPGSVGRPIDCRVEIRDADRLLGAGEIGEVHLRHYSSFFPVRRRFGAAAAGGVSNTGDLGYLDTDGFLYLTGRQDDLMIVGGHKVLPTEVESVLERHTAVREVAVAAVADPVLGAVPHAFVVWHDRPDAEGLRRLCNDALGPGARPVAFHTLDALPRGVTGKVERYKLVQAIV